MPTKSLPRMTDEFKLSEVVRKNGGLKAGNAYYVEGHYTRIREVLKRGGAPSPDLKRTADKKGWMVTPAADVPALVAPPPFTIPATMQKKGTIADVVAYLKTRPPGAKCGFTGGAKDNAHLHVEFLQRGIRVSYEGPYGNRVITLVAVDNSRVEAERERNRTKRKSKSWLISNVIKADGGIPAGVPTYVQGNKTTLIRQLRKYVGAGNYSTDEIKEGEVRLPRFRGHTTYA